MQESRSASPANNDSVSSGEAKPVDAMARTHSSIACAISSAALEANHSRETFQRMQRARQVMERRGLGDRATRLVENEQCATNGLQMLVALGEIVVDELVEEPAAARHAHTACSNGLSCDTRVVGTNGFVR